MVPPRTVSREAHFIIPWLESRALGSSIRVWALAHILPGARIGRDHTFIENDVVLGDRVTVKSGVQLWDGIEFEDDVFVGPNATFTYDPFLRICQHLERFPRTLVKRAALRPAPTRPFCPA